MTEIIKDEKPIPAANAWLGEINYRLTILIFKTLGSALMVPSLAVRI